MSNHTEFDQSQWERIFTLLDAGSRWYSNARAWFEQNTQSEVYVFDNGPQDTLRVEITNWHFASAPLWVVDALRRQTRTWARSSAVMHP